MKKKQWKAEELMQLLRNKYSDSSRYAVFAEVCNGTGHYAGSWIDAVVVHLWPSDSLSRLAFEIKVNRNDFLNEIASPTKNGWVHSFCNQFWYIAPSDVIRGAEEVPESCGLMKPHGNGLSVVKAAQRHDADCDDMFFASLCRSMQKEADNRERRIKTDLLKTDKGHIEAVAYRSACKNFLRQRNVDCWGYGEPLETSILTRLEEASVDKSDKKNRERLLSVMSRFQDRMLDLHDIVTVLAYVGLMEKDEFSEELIKIYGGKDASTLAYHRDKIKTAKRNDNTNHIKSTVRKLEAIFKMGEEFNGYHKEVSPTTTENTEGAEG